VKPLWEKSIPEAMDEMASSMEAKDMNIKPVAPTEEGDSPADVQVLVRVTAEEKEMWKKAAALLNLTMSAYIRELCSARAQELLVCGHPINQRRWYPWAEFCLKCSKRLRG